MVFADLEGAESRTLRERSNIDSVSVQGHNGSTKCQSLPWTWKRADPSRLRAQATYMMCTFPQGPFSLSRTSQMSRSSSRRICKLSSLLLMPVLSRYIIDHLGAVEPLGLIVGDIRQHHTSAAPGSNKQQAHGTKRKAQTVASQAQCLRSAACWLLRPVSWQTTARPLSWISLLRRWSSPRPLSFDRSLPTSPTST